MTDRILFAFALAVSLCFGYGYCWEQDLMFSLGINDDHLVIGARGGFDPKVYYRVLDYPYTARYAAIEKDFEEDPGRVLWAVHYPFPRYLYSAMVGFACHTFPEFYAKGLAGRCRYRSAFCI